MRTSKLSLLVGLALLTTTAQAAPPKPDFTNLPGYIRALNRSQGPQAIAIRRQIADGPVSLARERVAWATIGIPLDPKTVPLVPTDQDAAPLWAQWNTLRLNHPQLPMYADSLSANYAYSPEQLVRFQKFFDDNREAMDALHQAADRPFFTGVNSDFTKYAMLREAARELRSESYLMAHQGHYAEAVTDQARGFRIAKQIAFRPTLLGYLVGNAIDAITLSGMRDILYLSEPNANVSAQVQQAIQAARPVLSLKSTFVGEAAYSLSTREKLRSSTSADLIAIAQQDVYPFKFAWLTKTKTLTPVERQFLGNLQDAVEAQYLSQARRLMDVADQSPPARRAAFAAFDSTTIPPDDPVIGLSDELCSLAVKIEEHDDQRIAGEEVILAAASALAVKARTGAFPDALLGSFPDPFTGKPLGYRHEGDNGFVVYSVGPNGKFDGGKPGSTSSIPRRHFSATPARRFSLCRRIC